MTYSDVDSPRASEAVLMEDIARHVHLIQDIAYRYSTFGMD
jgi:hypothetical protein